VAQKTNNKLILIWGCSFGLVRYYLHIFANLLHFKSGRDYFQKGKDVKMDLANVIGFTKKLFLI